MKKAAAASFVLPPGENRAFVVVGFTEREDGAEEEVGPVAARVTSTDNHTIQVSDKGNGTGSVTAVGSAGGTADVLVDDGQGHVLRLAGAIETPPVITRLELRILEG